MKNVRGAGRKPKISNDEIFTIKTRIANGGKITDIAAEYGVSRQALYKKLKEDDIVILDYVVGGKCTTRIEINPTQERLQLINYTMKLSDRAFGANANPNWDDLRDLLQNEILHIDDMDGTSYTRNIICKDTRNDIFSLDDVLSVEKGRFQINADSKMQKIPVFCFSRKDILFYRTDTDGYQLKALACDRRLFVKSQALLGGKCVDDWAVELIASDFCKQLGIRCVSQHECNFVYGKHCYKAVCSKNFELDGYSFISFERLLERMGLSSNDEAFIRLDAIRKLKWCAQKLALAGDVSYELAQKYMLDLALIDCLVGNVDRHTKNFGLFYNSNTGKYEIPAIFDNGMGLFEHDAYREQYESFDDAMMNVYVAPYGEDPFDMLNMLDKEFDLCRCYPKLHNLQIHSAWMTPLAKEYLERILALWQK